MIKGIMIDYGGTIDTDSVHWSEVLWEAYQKQGVPVAKAAFRDAYVHGERTLARQPLIKPEYTMLDLLRIKVAIELDYLIDNEFWQPTEQERAAAIETIASCCDQRVWLTLETARPLLRELAQQYPLVLVSNFYGNLRTLLKHYRLDFFSHVVESAVVGVRKPDTQIYRLGLQHLGLAPEEVVMIGDSYDKDILPAAALGCRTIWIKGIGWNDTTQPSPATNATSVATATITTLSALPEALSKLFTNTNFPN